MPAQSSAARWRWLRVLAVFILLFTYLVGAAEPAQAAGTVSLTTLGSAYAQDFNTLANSGTTNTTLPTGWDLIEAGGGARDNEQYAADNGGSTTGDIYSYGATGSTERAFGGLRSGTLIPTIGASFTNNTGATVISLAISYTGEQWRSGVTNRGAPDRIDFQLSTDATSLTTGAWVDYNSLDFNSPNINATAGALDGNAPSNRSAVSSTITGLSIANGSSFWIRWTDFDITSSDDGLSVDDFSITPSVVDTAPSVDSTTPADNATGVAVDGNIDVTFSEGVDVTGSWFTISCGTSGLHTASVGGGPTTFTLNPDTDFANSETCTVTVDAALVSDQDTNDPPDTMAANYVFSFSTAAPLPPPGSVVISEVYGGGGNTSAPFKNDFIELYNRTANTISLSGWSVQYGSATGTTWAATPLSGSIAPGKYYLVQEAAGNSCSSSPCGVDLPTPDATGNIAMGATAGKVALVNSTSALSGGCPTGANISDFVGYGTTANCFEGSGPTPAPSNTTSVLRAGNGATDTDNNALDFSTGAPDPHNSADPAPSVSSTTPANNAVGVALNANISITFSEPVNVTGSWFTINCASSAAHTATVTGGPTSFTLDPDSDFVSLESCTVTVVANQVTDQDTDDPPDTMAANYVFSFTATEVLVCSALGATFIHDIQGSGATSPMNGTANVVIEGIVVGDYQGSDQFSGYHVQEEDSDADADPATSEGIFVFNTSFPVNVGDKVRVKGTVTEFTTSGVFLTELTNISALTVCNSDNTVTASNVILPVSDLNDWERYEGMLINIPQDLTATETFTLGRFGEVSLSVNGRLRNPTNIVAPGAPAIAQQDLNNRSRILLDDGNGQQNIDPTIHPIGGLSAFNTLRSGYTVHGLTGVLEQRFGVYRVQPVGSVSFDASTNLRTPAPDPVGGNLKVAALNVLNFFTSLDTGSPICGPTGGLDCRGANSAFEFTRQRDKIINAILAIDPDIAGLMEVQNDASATIQNLVDGLNAIAGGGTYAYINTGTIGTDAIKVAIIYKPAVVTPVGSYAILDSSVNPLFIDTKNRPTLAQTFKRNANGAKLTVVVNHLKSKGSACDDVGDPDTGDGQGNCNLTRTKAATALVAWLATDPTGSGDPDFLVVGDMNSYAKEDPITTIKNAGYTNLLETLIGADAYSYVFDGQSGYLDHALASASLTAQTSGVTEWHNNADEPTVLDYNVEFKTANQINTFYTPEPYRASDHDPVVVGLNLNAPPTVDAGGPYAVGEGGSVVVTAVGNDPDGGSLTYAWDLDNNGSFETPGQSVTFSAVGLDGPSSHTIKVRVTDNGNLTAVDEATVNVSNLAPTVNTPTVNPEPSYHGGSATASATFSDPGPSDGPFACTVNYGDSSGNQSGTVSGNTCTGPAHTYANDGSYTVTVTVTDKDTAFGSATTTHVVQNRPPVAVNDSVTTAKNTSVTIDALANDTDADGDSLAVVNNTQPAHGTVKYSAKNNNFRYTPANGFKGTDNFTYTISDGHGGTDTATVTITVT